MILRQKEKALQIADLQGFCFFVDPQGFEIGVDCQGVVGFFLGRYRNGDKKREEKFIS